ncbi:MAG: ribosome biogenesis GTPase Der, partial [Clostridia bacterium]|nr:ribosome biogenesis GTPase Der [Clostridia bacterium]
MSKPIVAIVGRPNVGKSTFFNKLCGKRISIVEDTPGVTRDRIYFETEWAGRSLMMIDTGGIEPENTDIIMSHIKAQAQIAIDSADVIIYMCDFKAGVTADDRELALMLRKSKKPIVLAVNKMDKIGSTPAEFYEFYELGLGDPIALSSVHGTGSGDVLEKVCEYLGESVEEDDEDDYVKVAVIGRPNAGKSSLVNRILGEERMIVSDMAGTTRDAIDSKVENDYGKFVFIDTAGIRKSGKIEDNIERYSVFRAQLAVERADVCVIMIDATEGVTAQDERVAGIAHENGKPSVIVINKWDLVEKDGKTLDNMRKDVYAALSYMTYAPVLFISAKTGQRVDRIFELVNYVNDQSQMRISTGMLNDVLNDAITRVQPPSDKGKRLKIYYMT